MNINRLHASHTWLARVWTRIRQLCCLHQKESSSRFSLFRELFDPSSGRIVRYGLNRSQGLVCYIPSTSLYNSPLGCGTRIYTEEALDCPEQDKWGSWWNPPLDKCLVLQVFPSVALKKKREDHSSLNPQRRVTYNLKEYIVAHNRGGRYLTFV